MSSGMLIMLSYVFCIVQCLVDSILLSISSIRGFSFQARTFTTHRVIRISYADLAKSNLGARHRSAWYWARALNETAKRPCLANGSKSATIVDVCRSSYGSGVDNDSSFSGPFVDGVVPEAAVEGCRPRRCLRVKGSSSNAWTSAGFSNTAYATILSR